MSAKGNGKELSLDAKLILELYLFDLVLEQPALFDVQTRSQLAAMTRRHLDGPGIISQPKLDYHTSELQDEQTEGAPDDFNGDDDEYDESVTVNILQATKLKTFHWRN